MYEILDFDANFAAYSEKWMEMNKKKFKNIEQMEDAMPDVYMHWLNSPAAFLQGEAPGLYFQRFDNAAELVRWLEAYLEANVPVPDPLMERITDLGEKSVSPLMRAAADSERDAQMRVTALNLLKEIETDGAPLNLCLEIIDSREADDEVADVAAELLQTLGEECVPPILTRINEVTDEARETYLDVLCNFPGDERIFPPLMEAFETHPDKRALYASYLGKLGDPRAIEGLKDVLTDPELNYLDYLEIRNAVEMLGGTVEIDREFAGDPYYEALKGQ